MKYGEMYPRSNCLPSTTSSSVSRDFSSSTVITPSLPTFFIAWARNWPISASPFAEIVPTCAISWLDVTFLVFFCRSATTASTARSMPRLRSIGFMPAATALEPSLTMAWARTVAVVVPSPAKSEDFEATSRTICAPMFSNLSSSSISLATVTPSLVMRGAPNDLSSTTLRPLGPSVHRTAWARGQMSRSILARAATENLFSLAAISGFLCCISPQGTTAGRVRTMRISIRCFVDVRGGSSAASGQGAGSGGLFLGLDLIQHAHDVALFHDQVLDAIDLDFGARPFSEPDAVADPEVDRDQLAAFIAAARTNSDDLALLRLLHCCVGNDDAAGSLRLGVDALDDNAVVKWAKFHRFLIKLQNDSIFQT